MYTLLIILHIAVCLLLCVVVLLQSSKGGGLAGAFGGGGGMPQQIFGTRGMTTLLHKLTIYFAVGFFLTSALLFAAGRGGGEQVRSVVGEAQREGTLAPDVTPPASAPDAGLPPLPGAQAPAGSGAQPQPPQQPAGGSAGGGSQEAGQGGGS